MSVLVTTLRSLLNQADSYMRAGRYSAALSAWEDLVQRSQEKTNRPMEVIARSMRARCFLRRRDLDGAREELSLAAMHLDPQNLESYGRYRSSLVRLAIEEGPETARRELMDFLLWAEEVEVGEHVLDACVLLGQGAEQTERVEWLQRGIDYVLDRGDDEGLGSAFNQLGAALDQTGHQQEALEAYQQALVWHRKFGTIRDVVGACWAVGAMACQLEDWPLAREALENAQLIAEDAEGCDDLLALATADLAQVYEAAGDVIEARRLVLRALELSRQQDLSSLWPQRWHALLDHAKRLELTV